MLSINITQDGQKKFSIASLVAKVMKRQRRATLPDDVGPSPKVSLHCHWPHQVDDFGLIKCII